MQSKVLCPWSQWNLQYWLWSLRPETIFNLFGHRRTSWSSTSPRFGVWVCISHFPPLYCCLSWRWWGSLAVQALSIAHASLDGVAACPLSSIHWLLRAHPHRWCQMLAPESCLPRVALWVPSGLDLWPATSGLILIFFELTCIRDPRFSVMLSLLHSDG